MIWMLIIIATSNAVICILLQKPLVLALGILGSTAVFVCIMVLLVKYDKQMIASYFYSFSINLIVLVYITIDKEMGDVLYLFVTIIMSTTYLNIKNTIFSAILAKSVCLYSFFVLDLFGTDFGLIFYYLFSQFCFMMILSYLCLYFNQTLKKLTNSEEENRLRAATLQENSKEKQVQIELLEQFSFELKQNIEEINHSSSFFYEQLTENSASLDQQQVAAEETTTHLHNIEEQANNIHDLSEKVRNRMYEYDASIHEYNQEHNQLQVNMDDLIQSFKKSQKVMGKLRYQMADVTESTDTLNDITSQTHILSLNTSIEAAKAHESTFGILAQELRLLTENSDQSTKTIQNNVLDMNVSIEETHLLVNETSNFLENVHNHHQKLQSLFQYFQEANHYTKEEMQRVFSLISNLKKNIADIYEKMKENQYILNEHATSQEIMKNNFEEYKSYIDNIQNSFIELETIFQQ